MAVTFFRCNCKLWYICMYIIYALGEQANTNTHTSVTARIKAASCDLHVQFKMFICVCTYVMVVYGFSVLTFSMLVQWWDTAYSYIVVMFFLSKAGPHRTRVCSSESSGSLSWVGWSSAYYLYNFVNKIIAWCLTI